MKRIIVFSLIGALLLSGDIFGACPVPVPSATPGLNFVFKIIFKRKKYDCERGFGLCLITSVYWGEYSGLNEPQCCLADVSLNERNQLTVKVSAESVTKYDGGSALPYFKDKTSITIPDPYPLPDETLRALGTKSALTIQPGTYPLILDDGIYTIVFQL